MLVDLAFLRAVLVLVGLRVDCAAAVYMFSLAGFSWFGCLGLVTWLLRGLFGCGWVCFLV